MTPPSIQTWRAGAIDDATRPSNNPDLKGFITSQGLAKPNAPPSPESLSEMSRFSSLHHVIAKDTLKNRLAPALKNGWNSQDAGVRDAARKFLDKVKEATPFHADILEQGGPQVEKFATLLRNIPLNLEIGYESPVGNPGESFDPRVAKGETVEGITSYSLDPVSAILSQMDDILQTLTDKPTQGTWERLTELLDQAVVLYDAEPKLGSYLRRPDLEQWDIYGDEAQRKTPGRYVNDVGEAFDAAGNPYAKTADRADVGGFEEAWRLTRGDLDITREVDFDGEEVSYHFTGIDYVVNLRHIAGRHTMRYFQFEPTATNTFFAGIDSVAALKEQVRQIIDDQITPLVKANVEGVDIAQGEYLDLKVQGVNGAVYMDFSTTTDEDPETDDTDRVVVTIATLAPEAGAENAIAITKPKVDAFVASKG